MSERDCTCLGSCKGAAGLAPGWRCALVKDAPAVTRAAVSERDYEARLAEAARVDVARFAEGWSNADLADTLEHARRFTASGCHAALNVAAHRLRALSSAPAPEERHDCERWRNEGVCCSRCVEVVYGAAASPSGAGSPVAWRVDRVRKLAQHGPFIVWDEDDALQYDDAERWIVTPLYAAPPAAGREPSEAEVVAEAHLVRELRVIIDDIVAERISTAKGVERFLAFHHANLRVTDAMMEAGLEAEAHVLPFPYEERCAIVRAIIRAALGASAQTNTGEAR